MRKMVVLVAAVLVGIGVLSYFKGPTAQAQVDINGIWRGSQDTQNLVTQGPGQFDVYASTALPAVTASCTVQPRSNNFRGEVASCGGGTTATVIFTQPTTRGGVTGTLNGSGANAVTAFCTVVNSTAVVANQYTSSFTVTGMVANKFMYMCLGY